MNNKTTFKLSTWLLALALCYGLSSCHKPAKPDLPVPSTSPVLQPASSQWVQMNTLPPDSITALEIFNNVIYAASSTSGKIYESGDGGASWSATASIGTGIHISSITVFNGKIYVGTSGDMFLSTDNGKTWVDEGGLTSIVTSFTVWNNNLYCSSFDNRGKGVLKLNPTNNQWEVFLNGLTSTPGINDVRASKVMVANNYLVAATSDVFGVFDPAQQMWHQKDYVDITKTKYKNVRFPNYVVDMVYNQGSILTQIYIGNNNQQSILRTDDGGITLYPDTVGMKADTDDDKYLIRGLLVTERKVYSVINQEKGTVGVWIQSRDNAAVANTTWASGEEFLPGLRSHALRSLTNTLFLATDNGIYYKKTP
ncbi:WD40/YVTN/BNR-like repeat-containing protein [Mucilaginibacter sp. AW1-3]